MKELSYQEISEKVSEALTFKPKTLTDIIEETGLQDYKVEVKEVLLFLGSMEKVAYVKNDKYV